MAKGRTMLKPPAPVEPLKPPKTLFPIWATSMRSVHSTKRNRDAKRLRGTKHRVGPTRVLSVWGDVQKNKPGHDMVTGFYDHGEPPHEEDGPGGGNSKGRRGCYPHRRRGTGDSRCHLVPWTDTGSVSFETMGVWQSVVRLASRRLAFIPLSGGMTTCG